jgi:hypothetical protein
MSRALVRAVALTALAGIACSSGGGGGAGAAASGPGASGGGAGASSAGDDASADTSVPDSTDETVADWCAAHSTPPGFCEDFDEGVPGKLASRVYGGGVVAGDVTVFVSGGESMWASVPPSAGPTPAAAALAMESFVTTSSHPRLQAEFQVAADCAATELGTTLIAFTFGPYSISIATSSAGTSLLEDVYGADGGLGGAKAYPLASPIPTRVWSVLVLDVDLSGQRANVTISGAEGLADQALSLVPIMAYPMSGAFNVGTAVPDGPGRFAGCQVHVDNVLLELL